MLEAPSHGVLLDIKLISKPLINPYRPASDEAPFARTLSFSTPTLNHNGIATIAAGWEYLKWLV